MGKPLVPPRRLQNVSIEIVWMQGYELCVRVCRIAIASKLK